MTAVVNIVLNDFTNDSRVLKTSQSLKKNGYDVTIVAMHNTGLESEDRVGDIPIDRVTLRSRSWSKARVIQVFKYIEFLMKVFFRYRKADIFHCNDLNALPIGVLAKIFRPKVKIVYDCHEFQTEINGISAVEKIFKSGLEKVLIRFADKVITVSDSIANEYKSRYKIDKPVLVLNCPLYDEPLELDLFRSKFNLQTNQKIFLYQGALSKGRGIEALINAFSSFEDTDNVLVFMGYGELEEYISRVASSSLSIYFHKAVSPEVLLDYTASADYGISLIEDSCLSYRYCLPNKLFEYFMAGIPVITSNLYEMRRIVENNEVGVVSSSDDGQSIRNSIYKIRQLDYLSLKNNVLSLRNKYNWEQQEKVLINLYNRV